MQESCKNNVELRTYDHNKILRFESIVRCSHHPSYRCNLVVDSNGFSARREFYFDEWNLKDFVTKLTKMAKNLEGSATLKQEYEPDYVTLEVEQQRGHVTVTGELWQQSVPAQHLTFAFITDQTSLAPLVEDFQHLLKLGKVR